MRKWLLIISPPCLLGALWFLFYHAFNHAIGIDTQLSDEYAFFSGFGTWLLAAMGYTGVLTAILHHLNCHARGCWRIARYPVAGGDFKVCQRHHPDPIVRGGPKAGHIAHKHAQHLLRNRS